MERDPFESYDDPDLQNLDETMDPLMQTTASGIDPNTVGQMEAYAQAPEPELPEELPLEETLPEELMVTDPLQLIPIAIAQNRLLQIQYINKKGEMKLYIVEPAEVGGHSSHPSGYLWAFDRNAGTVKSFFLSNLTDIQILNEIFIPY